MQIEGLDLVEWLRRYWRQDEPQTKWLNWWRGYCWPNGRFEYASEDIERTELTEETAALGREDQVDHARR